MHSKTSANPVRRFTPFLIPAATIDSDGDGTMDAWDRNTDGKADAWDSDGDSKPDLLDTDGDGRPDQPDDAGQPD